MPDNLMRLVIIRNKAGAQASLIHIDRMICILWAQQYDIRFFAKPSHNMETWRNIFYYIIKHQKNKHPTSNDLINTLLTMNPQLFYTVKLELTEHLIEPYKPYVQVIEYLQSQGYQFINQ